MIIDSHVHVSYLKKRKTFLEIKKELLIKMKENKVDYAIVIPDNEPNIQCADLESVLRLTEEEPRLFAVGTLKVNQVNEKNLKKIDNLFKKGKIKGFKIFPGHDPVYPTDERWFPVYNLCIKHDLPLIVHTGINTGDEECARYNDPKYIVEIAKKFSGIKIVISHYFWPQVEYCYKTTRGYNNIYFDTSALAVKEVIEKTGSERIKKVLEKTVKDNPESVLFGTDYVEGKFKEHIDLIDSLDITDEKKVFWKNADKVFKLNLLKKIK